MDFTREPIIETVITPKEGCTLAVRSSKGTGQEEYFVDAVEVVSFGNALFFRSLERPKNFMLPVSDYEILEVRETRLVLKNVGLDRSIKIAGGREAPLRTAGRGPQEKTEQAAQPPMEVSSQPAPLKSEQPEGREPKQEVKLDKKRDRRRNYKRKKGRDELQEEETDNLENVEPLSEKGGLQPQETAAEPSKDAAAAAVAVPVPFSSLLPPPSTLISETIARYKDNALFRGAFFVKEGEAATGQEGPSHTPAENLEIDHPQLETPQDDEVIELPSISLDLPAYIPPEMSEEEEERIYQERRGLRLKRHKRGEDSDDNDLENTEPEVKLSVEESQRRFAKEFEDDLEIPNEQAIKNEPHHFEDNVNGEIVSIEIEDINAQGIIPEGVNPEELNSDLHQHSTDFNHKKSTGNHSVEDNSSDYRD